MPIAHLPPFRQDADFVFLRPIICAGEEYQPGDRVPSEALNARRLRQLYDQRKIGYAPEKADEGEKPPKPPQVGDARPNFLPTKTDHIAIPEDWRDLHWKVQQKLAEQLTGVRPANKNEAIAAIEHVEAERA